MIYDLETQTDLDALDACLFEFLRFRTIVNIAEEDPENYVWLLRRTKSERGVQFRCLLPNTWINRISNDFHGSIRFSGTLSPGLLFNEEHGLEGPIKNATLSPNASRLSVYVVSDITTYFNERALTAPELAGLIESIGSISRGNWLIAFPSFAYMDLVLEHMSAAATSLVAATGV